jgi:hypothetical protein
MLKMTLEAGVKCGGVRECGHGPSVPQLRSVWLLQPSRILPDTLPYGGHYPIMSETEDLNGPTATFQVLSTTRDSLC